MVEASLAASAVLTGLAVLGILAVLTLTRRRHPSMLGQEAAGSGFISQRQQTKSWAASTDALFAAFALLTIGAFGTVIFYVNGNGFEDPYMLLSVVALGIGVLLGSYSLGENAGIGSAGATFVTALVIAVILVAVVAMNLITGA
ncbi:hypothetical protein L593_14990 [Salinarchaeum sp. Harcht-Bsk1]|uniref:hypothetical protein n=1 Tax=Salinarchaeum sp. Harcht-Bsk1 TaxID=1333523 RepID=UPI00034249C6|nr:hypothetical protein [Salinarchaeum sp. Harcht-Bsk1]AGN02932.1 hypothetical protein L593_14990 [Salinarchaeum sp. Harcht-Bsk1]